MDVPVFDELKAKLKVLSIKHDSALTCRQSQVERKYIHTLKLPEPIVMCGDVQLNTSAIADLNLGSFETLKLF